MKPARFRIETADDLAAFYAVTFDEVTLYARRLAGGDRSLAEDLVQEAFLGLVRAVRRGDAPRDLGAGWLIASIRHRFIDQVRSKASTDKALRRAHAGGDGVSEMREVDLSRLDPVDRLALVLHHADGWSVKDVAAAIGRSTRATESLLARARRTARQLLTVEVEHD